MQSKPKNWYNNLTKVVPLPPRILIYWHIFIPYLTNYSTCDKSSISNTKPEILFQSMIDEINALLCACRHLPACVVCALYRLSCMTHETCRIFNLFQNQAGKKEDCLVSGNVTSLFMIWLCYSDSYMTSWVQANKHSP